MYIHMKSGQLCLTLYNSQHPVHLNDTKKTVDIPELMPFINRLDLYRDFTTIDIFGLKLTKFNTNVVQLHPFEQIAYVYGAYLTNFVMNTLKTE
jgi:hypothetical protein